MSAVTPEWQPPTRGRLLRRVGSALTWGGVLLLGAFGIYFTFANYPLFGVGVVLAMLLLTAYRERKRRSRQRASERVRREARTRSRDLSRG
jgi:hypothetical protein